MKKSKAICLLLCLSLLASLLIPGTLAMPAKAAEGDTDNGMKVNKTAVANGDDTYTITLEAYATGSKVITEVTEDVPTDIVLVLDQSGSMADAMTSSKEYSEYKNQINRQLRRQRFNGGDKDLYYPVEDGHVEVSVDREEIAVYTEYSNRSNSTYYDNSNRLYIKDAEGNYLQVRVDRSGTYLNRQYTYSVRVNGEQQIIATSTGRNEVPDFGNYGPLYRASTAYKYTYYYQLEGEDRVIIEESTGADTVPNETYYYQSGTNTTSRLEALKTAVTNFANSVALKAAGPDGKIATTEDNVNHRIAVVGFASQSGYGDNTELLSISGTNSGSVGVAYNAITQQNLKDVLQDMDTTAGQTMVTNAISALAANGATETDLGMDMAQRILSANPVGTEKRNRVVIVFTDGSPTSFNGFEVDVADNAILKAQTIKNSGVTVYSVGVFPGADATSAGIKPSDDLDQNSSSLVSASNWFMQNVSSNNGTPQTPSYYLSASDANTLNTIFQKISDQIESGGSSTTLGESAVVKDIIAPAFSLPAGATASDITLETYKYTGENKWSKNSDAMGATATVNGEQVSVTGFDFAGNYVGTVNENGNVTYRGNKLVISFTVAPKDGFLGGNNVFTNTSAGIYENSSATEPVKTFPWPQVNVPIKDVTVTAQDKNVYLLGSVSASDIQTGATVKCGDVPLDLSKADKNYGLQDWQTEYVDITVAIKDKDGNAIPTDGLKELRDDTTYTITAIVKPKYDGDGADGTPATAVSGVNKPLAKINVFKPVLTYKDSDVYYGDTAPENYNSNLTNTEWKHDETVDTSVAMIGDKPTLDITYTPESGKIVDNKINTKQDIAVDVTVKIDTNNVTDYTTFQHTDCTGLQCGNPDNGRFWLHVKTCQLTITKSGGADGEPYVFAVKKDGKKYSEVTIVGNKSETIYELPVGTYTIEEDTGWSWRYTGNNGNGASLTAQSPSDTITCANTKDKNFWLNGYSDVVTNIFGVKH